ncbi:hypothetical protein RvY_00041-1 [Ramazzottius varieornatus]|uniref:Uncharacterized protein n=1 Tax=Ramazzottius varieornatus TaxID=947166 RepID=A0A1D1ULW7_RAMVA|nr:hypothetical protein RvY_00041-1 [Ramazzottius varieornatus]
MLETRWPTACRACPCAILLPNHRPSSSCPKRWSQNRLRDEPSKFSSNRKVRRCSAAPFQLSTAKATSLAPASWPWRMPAARHWSEPCPSPKTPSTGNGPSAY